MDIRDFVVTDEAYAHACGYESFGKNTSECLFIKEDNHQLWIAVYYARELIEHLHKDNPVRLLHDGNLNHFWILLEGISHFLYLSWSARFNRSVSPFELELQAEVDKFVITAALIKQQQQHIELRLLHQTLFHKTALRPDMENAVMQRYLDANHYAGKYCARLEKHFSANHTVKCLNELRRFYRYSQQAKLRHIEQAHAYI